MQHVLHNHWKSWNCAQGCDETFDSAEEAKDHIVTSHPEVSDPTMLVNMGERPRPLNAPTNCPLCQQNVSSLREYGRHVGRHQKNLALFALPRLSWDDDAENLNQEQEQQEGSVDSDETSSEVCTPPVDRGDEAEHSHPQDDPDDVEVRIIEQDRDPVLAFLSEVRPPDPSPLVLREREIETTVTGRRSPSPVRVRETRIVRARSVSPIPKVRTEEDIRYRKVERVREPSRGPDLERLHVRILERDQPSSPSPPPFDRIRARTTHRSRSPSPIRERIRIVERERERTRSPSPQVIKGPIIEREVIPHYRDIDYGKLPRENLQLQEQNQS